jgi:hypothetical protein
MLVWCQIARHVQVTSLPEPVLWQLQVQQEATGRNARDGQPKHDAGNRCGHALLVIPWGAVPTYASFIHTTAELTQVRRRRRMGRPPQSATLRVFLTTAMALAWARSCR